MLTNNFYRVSQEKLKRLIDHKTKDFCSITKLPFHFNGNHSNLNLETKLAQIRSGGPKVGASNERFSAKVKLRCKLDIHTPLLSPPVYLRHRVGLQCFQGVT